MICFPLSYLEIVLQQVSLKEIILLMLIFHVHFPVWRSSPCISQQFFIVTGLHCRKYWFHRHLEDIYCLMISLLMLYSPTADVERSHFETGTHQSESTILPLVIQTTEHDYCTQAQFFSYSYLSDGHFVYISGLLCIPTYSTSFC